MPRISAQLVWASLIYNYEKGNVNPKAFREFRLLSLVHAP